MGLGSQDRNAQTAQLVFWWTRQLDVDVRDQAAGYGGKILDLALPECYFQEHGSVEIDVLSLRQPCRRTTPRGPHRSLHCLYYCLGNPRKSDCEFLEEQPSP